MKKSNQLSTKLNTYITKAKKNAKVIKLNLSDLDIAKQFELAKNSEHIDDKTCKFTLILIFK